MDIGQKEQTRILTLSLLYNSDLGNSLKLHKIESSNKDEKNRLLNIVATIRRLLKTDNRVSIIFNIHTMSQVEKNQQKVQELELAKSKLQSLIDQLKSNPELTDE